MQKLYTMWVNRHTASSVDCITCIPKQLINFVFLAFLVIGMQMDVNAQTVTITCTGSAGSFNSGSVSSGGVKNDGNMITINSGANRGWAHYDLSSIPASAIVSAVTANFTTYTSTLSTATNNLYGFIGNPSAITGTTLYANCATAPSLNASSWTASGNQAKVLNASGIAFIQACVGGNNCNIGYVRGSTNTYNIYGYSGVTPPNLVITYTVPSPCLGTPTPGNTNSTATSACSGTTFTLSLQNATSGSGVTYQWQSSPDNITYTNVASATAPTYLATMSATVWYRCEVTCTTGPSTALSNPVQVTLQTGTACLVYCASTASSTADEDISNVTFGTLNNSSGCATLAPGPGSVVSMYSNYRSGAGAPAAPLVTQLQAVPFSVTQTTCGGVYGNSFDIYIDYNQNGSFSDAGELVYDGASFSGNHTDAGTITIPISATVGTTVMRVINVEGGATSPCQLYTWGETEDYLIEILATTACGGTPTGSTTLASANPVCSGAAFNLSLSTSYTAAGLTFQWQSSPDNITYTNLGAVGVNPFYTGATQTAETWYRCEIVCTNGGSPVLSTPVDVTMNTFVNCYCSTNHTYGTSGGFYGVISNVTFNSLSNASSYPTVAPYYTSYPASGATTTTVVAGNAYNLDITSGYYNYVGAWFDWDQSGTFDVSEYIPFGFNSSGSSWVGSQSVTVPVTALGGVTGMRLRTEYYGYAFSGASACGLLTYGETEDYRITVVAAAPCVSPPTAGITNVSVNPACPSVIRTFTLSGNTFGTGQTYQWQNSPDNVTWSDIAGATASFYSGAVAANGYYRCVLDCGGQLDNSVSVPVQITPFINCYCASGATTTADEEIYSVTVNGAYNALGCGVTAPGAGSAAYQYSNFTNTQLTTLIQTVSTPFTVEENECDGATYYAFGTAIWIDYDHDGAFNETNEKVFVESSTLAGPRNVTGSFTVPNTALLGQTRMRITCAEGNSGPALTSCLSYGYGETEDYLVNIIAPPTCTDPPLAGTIGGVSSLCPSASGSLTLTGYTLGTALQWQSSPDNATWSNIAGETNAYYTITSFSNPLYYRVSVTCVTEVTTAGWYVDAAPFYACYCNTGLGGICGTQSINSVAIAGTTLNNVTGGCSTPYNSFPASGSTTATVMKQQSYVFTVGTGNNGNPAQIAVWIDYNHNGIFDATEYTLINSSSASGGSSSLAIGIPSTAQTGITGMRVRTDWASSTAFNGTIACNFLTYGETEDYIITIDPAPICSDPPTAGTITGTSYFCTGGSTNLTLAGYTLGTSLQWQSSPDNITWTNITGEVNSYYTATALAYYRVEVTCISTVNTPSFQVTAAPFTECYCSSLPSQTADEEIYSVTVDGVNFALACGITAAGPGSIAYRYSNNNTGTPTFTLYKTVASPFDVEEDECDGATYYAFGTSIYIDYNHNGLFSDAGEQVFVENATAAGPRHVVGTITPPSSALLGNTVMRVIVAEGISGAGFSPCLAYGYGETEDYLINIQPAPTCTDPPVGGTISGVNSVCSGSGTTLSLAGYTLGTTIQWQESQDNVVWNNVTGATNATFTSGAITVNTYYRVEVTCISSANSASYLVSVVPCINMPGSGVTTINNVCAGNFYDSGGPAGLYNSSESGELTVCPNPGNQLKVVFTSMQNETGWDPLYIYSGTSSATGTLFSSGNGTSSGGFPAGGWWGTTLPGGAGGYTSTDASGCLTFVFMSDGSVTQNGWAATFSCISNNCSGTPVITGITQPSLNCPGQPTLLQPSPGSSGGIGLSYLWEESDDNGTTDPWSAAPGTNSNRNYTTPALSSTKYYRVTMGCSFSSAGSTSSGYGVQFIPGPTAYGSSTSPVCEGVSLGFSSDNIDPGQPTGNTFSWTGPNGFNSTQQSPTISLPTSLDAGTYTVVVTNQYLCTASYDVVVEIRPNPTASVTSQTLITCYGGSNGDVTIGATGGQPGYLFTDGANFNTDGIFTGYSAGLVDFFVYDTYGCVGTTSATVLQNPPTTISNAGTPQNVCGGQTFLAGNTPVIGVGAWQVISGSGTFVDPLDPATSVSGLSLGNNVFEWTISNNVCANSNSSTVTILSKEIPSATISGSVDVCLGNPAQLNVAFTGTAPWTYSVSNGSTTYGPFTSNVSPDVVNVTPTTTAPQSYFITNVSSNGCSDLGTGTANVTIHTAPPANIATSSLVGWPSYACNGQTNTLSCNAALNGVTYIWDAPAGSYFDGNPLNTAPYTSSLPTVTITFGNPSGSGYQVSVKATNGCGSSLPRGIWVRGTTSVPSAITGNAITCASTSATYSCSTVTGATGYAWTPGAGMSISSGQGTNTVTVDFDNTFTSGTLCVAATTPCYVSPNKCFSITKSVPSVPQFTGTFSACAGQTLTYCVATQQGVASYQWTLPPGASGSSTSNCINITFNAGFNGGLLSCSAVGVCGDVSLPRTKNIYLGSPSVPASITGPFSGLCGQTIIYSCPSQSGVTFNWTNAAGTLNSGQGSNAISTTFGTFTNPSTVCVTASNSCGSSTPRCVTVTGKPNVPGAITAIPSSWCANTSGVEFDVNVTPLTGSYTLSWVYPGPSVATYVLGGGNSASLILDWITGSGPVNVTASNACGNQTRSSSWSNSCREDGIPMVVAENVALNVYPNPTTGNISVEFSASSKGNATVQILDISGRVVVSQDVTVIEGMNKAQFDLSHIAKGIYMLNVNSNDVAGKVKIVVE